VEYKTGLFGLVNLFVFIKDFTVNTLQVRIGFIGFALHPEEEEEEEEAECYT
jgi:hypothetical protein